MSMTASKVQIADRWQLLEKMKKKKTPPENNKKIKKMKRETKIPVQITSANTFLIDRKTDL